MAGLDGRATCSAHTNAVKHSVKTGWRRKIMIIVARRRRKCVRTLDITLFRITFQISVQRYLLDYG